MKLEKNTERFAFSLDRHSGIPVYRQLIDGVQGAVASGALRVGDQLPTVRQVAVDLEINPNTVMRAYREMESRGMLDTQQGTGTFVAARPVTDSQEERERLLGQLAGEFMGRVGAAGFTLDELLGALQAMRMNGSGRQ
jgi:GntR family transcriptional regulator